eukprot:gene11227-7798_t
MFVFVVGDIVSLAVRIIHGSSSERQRERDSDGGLPFPYLPPSLSNDETAIDTYTLHLSAPPVEEEEQEGGGQPEIG